MPDVCKVMQAETALVRALKLRREGQSAPKPRRPSNAQVESANVQGCARVYTLNGEAYWVLLPLSTASLLHSA